MVTATSRIRQTTTETDVAVLQVQVSTIETKLTDLKDDIKEVQLSADQNAKNIFDLLKEMRDNAEEAHSELSKKIGSLEKWRWMLMGAGVVLGSLGFETIAKLLK